MWKPPNPSSELSFWLEVEIQQCRHLREKQESLENVRNRKCTVQCVHLQWYSLNTVDGSPFENTVSKLKGQDPRWSQLNSDHTVLMWCYHPGIMLRCPSDVLSVQNEASLFTTIEAQKMFCSCILTCNMADNTRCYHHTVHIHQS